MARGRAGLTEILYLALCEPIGLVLATEEPTRIKTALYQAKYSAEDPALRELQIRRWPGPEGQLVVVRQHISLPAEAAQAVREAKAKGRGQTTVLDLEEGIL